MTIKAPSIFDTVNLISMIEDVAHPGAKWPPEAITSVLDPKPWVSKDRANWTIEDWQEYSNHLLLGGYELRRNLIRAREQLELAQRRLSRKSSRKGVKSEYILSLLEKFSPNRQSKKAGRPVNDVTPAKAAAALLIKEKYRQSGKKISDTKALEIWFRENGADSDHTAAKAARESAGIRAQMIKLRKKSQSNW